MKQEVRRGRKFVEYHDPETQDEFTFTQEISSADVSYQETDGSWHPADENWATDGVDGFVLKNDKLNHKIRLKGNGGRTWYPRRNVNTEYMTFGVPQYRNGNKWRNFSFSGWSVEGKTITLQTRQGVTILVHNRWNGIKIDWVLASSSAPSRMRYPVSLTGITYVDGIIYGADGAELGRLTPTTATDANGAELVCSGSFAGGYVEFQADVSAAQFPVTIDPDFAGSDVDQEILGFGYAYSTARNTATEIQNSGMYVIGIGQWTNGGQWSVRRGFVKFDTSSIPDTNVVTQVNLKLACATDSSDTDFDILIAKYDWSAYDPITAENKESPFDGCLAATLDDGIWRNTSGMSTNTRYASENLNTSWINKTGATYYGLLSKEDKDNSNPTNSEEIKVYSVDHPTAGYRPLLTIVHSAPPAGTLLRVNMNAQMQSLTGGFN